MITSIQNRATIGRVMAFGYLIATLLTAMVLSAAPTGAAVPSGKAFGWGTNDYGELGNGTNDYSNLPVAVRDLSGVKSVKAGDGHGLALLQNGSFRRQRLQRCPRSCQEPHERQEHRWQ